MLNFVCARDRARGFHITLKRQTDGERAIERSSKKRNYGSTTNRFEKCHTHTRKDHKDTLHLINYWNIDTIAQVMMHQLEEVNVRERRKMD